jgi:hypothetical protein
MNFPSPSMGEGSGNANVMARSAKDLAHRS